MEKIKLTQEQADLIEGYKKRGISDSLKFIEAFSVQDRFYLLSNQCLNSLSVEELSICLLVSDSYEVIPQYKPGESIFISKEATHTGKDEIRKITDVQNGQIELEDNWCILANSIHIRHATPEEKKRRFWEKLGREVDEYKQGDIVTTGFGNYTSITKLEMNKKSVYFDGPEAERSFDEIYLVAPEEQRLDK